MNLTTYQADLAGDCLHCGKRRIDHVGVGGALFCPSDVLLDMPREVLEKAAAAARENASRNTAPAEAEPVDIDVNDILRSRGEQYGPFTGHAEITMQLKTVIAVGLMQRQKNLAADQMEALHMISHKIGRIINGNADNVDSWADIAGYAKLVADRLVGVTR